MQERFNRPEAQLITRWCVFVATS